MNAAGVSVSALSGSINSNTSYSLGLMGSREFAAFFEDEPRCPVLFFRLSNESSKEEEEEEEEEVFDCICSLRVWTSTS